MEEQLKKRMEKLEELPMPNKNKLIQNVIDNTSPINVQTGEFIKEPKDKRKSQSSMGLMFLLRPALVVLGLLAVIIIVSAYNVNHKYKIAYAFFEQENIPVKDFNLSDAEVKEVYEDISSDTFEKPNTKMIVEKSILNSSLTQNATSDDVKAIWKSKENSVFTPNNITSNPDTIEYGTLSGDNSYVKIVIPSETKVLYFPNYNISGYAKENNNVVLFGHDTAQDKPKIVFIDENQNIKWESSKYLSSMDTSIKAFIKGDTISLFSSRHENKTNYLLIHNFDLSGQLLNENSIQYIHFFKNVYQLDNNYIVQFESKNFTKLSILDNTGHILISTDFKLPDRRYIIEDIVQDEQFLYLSAYSHPYAGTIPEKATFETDDTYNSRDNQSDLLEKADPTSVSEDITQIVKDNYEATLIRFDINFQEPKIVNTQEASFASSILLENNRIKWNVLSILDAKTSLATSAFSVIINAEETQSIFPGEITKLPITPSASIQQGRTVEIRR